MTTSLPALGDEEGGRWIMVWEPDLQELLLAAEKAAALRPTFHLRTRLRLANLGRALDTFRKDHER